MTRLAIAGIVAVGAIVTPTSRDFLAPTAAAQSRTAAREDGAAGRTSYETLAYDHSQSRLQDDLAALQTFRPGFAFWQNIFTIPDGSIAFGSAVDGRLLAVFPSRGDWIRDAAWTDPELAGVLEGQDLKQDLSDRRDQVAALLETLVGPVLHNPTRGNFLLPNARRYGGFLQEWGAIYERFGVPAEVGLAQVIIESGLSGTRRSEARAVGFCQWLEGNWKLLNRLSPAVIEGKNQTTQAPYCAAYLAILATKYGSYIPALSEHHSGGTNVGRTLINGERLGASDARERYFIGAQLARDLRRISLGTYKDLYRTYGPRSYLYSEMVFGNTLNVRRLTETMPQERIYAMRTARAIPLADITRRTRLSADDVRRFNPALVKRVPAGATLYLPRYVKEFGADVTFWHRPATAGYAAVLNDFLRLDAPLAQWDDPAFELVLRNFERRFKDTRTEEGSVMATVLAYAIQDMYTSGRRAILAEFRASHQVLSLFEQGVVERDAVMRARASEAGEGNQASLSPACTELC